MPPPLSELQAAKASFAAKAEATNPVSAFRVYYLIALDSECNATWDEHRSRSGNRRIPLPKSGDSDLVRQNM